MEQKVKFLCRKWKAFYGEGINYINEMRLPYFNPALINLYAYGESSLSAEPEPLVLHKSYYCLEYTLEGEYIILQGENKYHLKKGDLFLGRPNCSYERKFPAKAGVIKQEINLNNSPVISLLCNHVGSAGGDVIYNSPPIVGEYFNGVKTLVTASMEIEEFTRKLSHIIFSLFTELKIHCSKENFYNSFDSLLARLDLFFSRSDGQKNGKTLSGGGKDPLPALSGASQLLPLSVYHLCKDEICRGTALFPHAQYKGDRGGVRIQECKFFLC